MTIMFCMLENGTDRWVFAFHNMVQKVVRNLSTDRRSSSGAMVISILSLIQEYRKGLSFPEYMPEISEYNTERVCKFSSPLIINFICHGKIKRRF